MASFSAKRLQKELPRLQGQLPPGITLVSADNLQEWQLDIEVLDTSNTIYLNQKFRLRFKFTNRYPIEPPEVMFIHVQVPPRSIPLHPHIYSNGIICLDLLGAEGWSPVQTVESTCMSLQSMLTGNHKAERPPDDAMVVSRNRSGPANMRFHYHDPNV